MTTYSLTITEHFALDFWVGVRNLLCATILLEREAYLLRDASRVVVIVRDSHIFRRITKRHIVRISVWVRRLITPGVKRSEGCRQHIFKWWMWRWFKRHSGIIIETSPAVFCEIVLDYHGHVTTRVGIFPAVFCAIVRDCHKYSTTRIGAYLDVFCEIVLNYHGHVTTRVGIHPAVRFPWLKLFQRHVAHPSSNTFPIHRLLPPVTTTIMGRTERAMSIEMKRVTHRKNARFTVPHWRTPKRSRCIWDWRIDTWIPWTLIPFLHVLAAAILFRTQALLEESRSNLFTSS